MRRFAHKASSWAVSHRYGLTLVAFLTAAALTGMACVLFMWAFDFVISYRLDFHRMGAWCWLSTPILFLISAESIRRWAPCAAGTGIPQAMFAAKYGIRQHEDQVYPLTSPLTLAVKILALLAAVWAGASTGREGPTVHVAACVFVFIIAPFRKWAKLDIDMRSAVIAGGAAGLAAAFNTPLAGVTFAVEELTADYFASIKDLVLMAIIIAAVAAKSMTGDYIYFGRLTAPPEIPFLLVAFIGIICGLAGAFFSTALLWGNAFFGKFQKGRVRCGVPILLSVGLLSVAATASLNVMGPGNKVAQILIQDRFENAFVFFPLTKMAATLLTYWSGIAGGIFAPCLSIGAAVGSDIGSWMGVSVAACALIGMAAFLSGTIQAPITAFVIIFEMTGHYQMMLPIMLASLLAFMVTRLIGARHLYQTLSLNYQYLLKSPGS